MASAVAAPVKLHSKQSSICLETVSLLIIFCSIVLNTLRYAAFEALRAFPADTMNPRVSGLCQRTKLISLFICTNHHADQASRLIKLWHGP